MFAIGQLARHMHNAGDEHWKEAERMVGYLKGKERHELIMRKPLNMRVISYGDSSYGDCKDTRRSSSGDFHTIGGALVSWRSQRLKLICLSSTEAEYVTMTEMAKEQRFIQMLIEEITGIQETGIIYGDNEAAMYLSKNKHVSARTKHIDIKNHYVRDHIEEGRALVKGEKTENNFADILTKNTSVSIFKKLSEAILKGFQGWKDKFTWKDSVNMIRTQQTNNTAYDQRQRENVVNNILHKNRYQTQHQNIRKYLKKNDKNNIQNKIQKEGKRAKYNGKNNNVHTWTSYADQYGNAHKNYAHKNYVPGLQQVCANHMHDKKKEQTEQNLFEKASPRQLNMQINMDVPKRTSSSLCKNEKKKKINMKNKEQLNQASSNIWQTDTNRWGNQTTHCRVGCRNEVENSRNSIERDTEEELTPKASTSKLELEIKITFE